MEIYVTHDKHTEEIWREFIELFNKNRYFISEEQPFIKHFLSEIIKDKPLSIKGKKFYRARINNLTEEKMYTNKELGAPPAEKVGYGRLNPKGIPYLYLSSYESTAVSEIRPFLNAKCTINKELRILDLMSRDNLDQKNNFRRLISTLFSKPINPSKAEIDYLPTQYIAEYFKNQNFDGVKYRSAMNSSHYNICLFNPEGAQVEFYKQVSVLKIQNEYE